MTPSFQCLKLRWLLVALGAILAMSACSQAPNPQTGATAPPPAAAPEAAPAAEPAAEEEEGEEEALIRRFGVGVEGGTARRKAMERERFEPPDGIWKVDENEREYFLREIPKDAERWYWTDQSKTSVRYGFDFYEVAEERPETLVVKSYRPMPSKVRGQPDLEAIAATLDSMKVEVKSEDRLTFTDFGIGLPQRGQWRNGFDVADMNGDGFLDILHGPPRKFGGIGPVIFLGDGAGSWQIWSDAKFPSGLMSYGDAAAADFNGDGVMDVAFGLHVQGVVAAVGDGNGRFSLWSEGIDIQFPGRGDDASGFSSRAIETADWNGDGKVDILALGEGPRPESDGRSPSGLAASSSFGTAIFLNHGDGTWQRLDQGLDFGQVFGDAIDVADFNGDARIDFVTSTSTRGERKLLNLGSTDGKWQIVALEGVRPGSYVRSVAAEDFDSDGRVDLALSYILRVGDEWWSGLDILYGRGEVNEWERRTLMAEASRNSVFAIATGNLDGDGGPDLIALTRDGDTHVFLGDGAGGLVREESPEIAAAPGDCRGYHVALADLDGDGRDEFIEAFAGEPSAFAAPDRCPSRGLMRAWDWEPASAAK
ncbi:MAG: VCBS repeat-containing protein [Acidobacteriota bacterium]